MAILRIDPGRNLSIARVDQVILQHIAHVVDSASHRVGPEVRMIEEQRTFDFVENHRGHDRFEEVEVESF